MNTMEYLRRINKQFDRGVSDAQAYKYEPKLTFGALREAYKSGHRNGCKMRRAIRKLADFKTK